MTKLSNTSSSTNKNKRQNLVSEIKEALKSVSYGSIEIFVQNKVVTQITVRNIKKTSVEIEDSDELSSQEIHMFQDEAKRIRRTIVKRVS